MAEDEECVVCYEPTCHYVRPCDHRVCEDCARRWVERSIRCPVCRSTLVAFTSPTHDAPTAAATTIVVHVPLAAASHVGVSLMNNDTGGGVRITHVRPQDLGACHGLRKGQVITHLNGIPVSNHVSAVEIVNAACKHGIDLACTIALPPRRRWPRCTFVPLGMVHAPTYVPYL